MRCSDFFGLLCPPPPRHTLGAFLLGVLFPTPSTQQGTIFTPGTVRRHSVSSHFHARLAISIYPVPYGQDRLKLFPIPGTEGLVFPAGVPGGGGGMVTAGIEPRITHFICFSWNVYNYKNGMDLNFERKKISTTILPRKTTYVLKLTQKGK